MSFTFIIGCKKEKATDTQVMNENSVFKFTIVDNRLSFSTIAEYENQIALMSTFSDDSLINSSTTDLFTSMYEYYLDNNNLENMPAEDVILSLILNPAGLIQINGYVFKVDLPNEDVLTYALTSNAQLNAEKITDLTNSIISQGILEFETDDDVLDILTEGKKSEDAVTGCPGTKLGYYYWNTSGGQVMYKTAYQKAGIYFSLQAKIKKDHYGGAEYISLSTNDDNNFGGTNFWKHKKSCNTFFDSEGGYEREYNIRTYNGTRGLTDYLFTTDFYCSDNGTTHSETLRLYCGNITKKCN